METHEIKRHLTELIINVLEKERDASIEGEKVSKDEAASHVGAMESRYDTFKEEAQYRASGHARRRSEIDASLHAVATFKDDRRCFVNADRVRLGALVTVVDYTSKDTTTYFIVPAGGGYTFVISDQTINTLNVRSPLAASMILHFEGDEASIAINGVERKMSIIKIK